MPLRIALVCPGDSMHTRPWVDELMRRGHEAFVYAYPPVTADFGDASVTVVCGEGPLARARWLRRQVRTDTPDIISQHYVATDAFALSMLGRPLVLSVWGSDVLRDLTSPPKRMLVAQALRSAALVVSPAEHLTERLTGFGVRHDRIFTRQYGVDTDVYAPGPGRASAGSATVICTRSMRPIYGHEDILSALPLLPGDAVQRVRLTGRGPLIPELRTMAVDLGVGDRVAFDDGVEDMPEALRGADIYCSMSRSDGASLSMLEAMSCGLPSVVSDIPANREWIVDGENGYLVPCEAPDVLAQRLETLACDASLRQRFGVAARSTVLERGDRAKNVLAIIDAVEQAVRRA
ncbi:MAG: glycosyltransferase family 4 protein [Coriobacteriia bacterium]|nr:glycosyltransferase family 4 protein [Coriobacteriia bacterium]